MNKTKFDITINSDSVLDSSSGIHISDDGEQLFITSSVLKHFMRKQFRNRFERKNINKNEEQIFGVLTKQKAIKSSFQISSAITDNPINQKILNHKNSNTNQLLDNYFVPKGTQFSGVLTIEAPPGSLEDICIKTALLSIDGLSTNTNPSGIQYKVSIEDRNLSQKVLYKSDIDHIFQLGKASIWLPNIEAEIIEYYLQHPNHMRLMSPRSFEELVAAIMKNQGFDVTLTPQTNDGGFDVFAVRHSIYTGQEKYLIECKRHSENNKVGVGIVRSLMGVVASNSANKGIVVTTSFFSNQAKEFAANNSKHLYLRDFNSLKSWLHAFKKP